MNPRQALKFLISDWQSTVKKPLGLSIFLIIALIGASAFSIYFFISDNNIDWRSAVNHQNKNTTARQLDGRLVAKEYAALKPMAITLENHVDSRPNVGLEDASVIYETVVEGDITRFLAIFDETIKTEKIGPIRSARPFFVQLAEEYNPVYFHAGGSALALSQLKFSSVININEISSDGIYFWRDKDRMMPHNLFTSANAKKIDVAADFLPWLFKNDSPQPDLNSQTEAITINFLGNPDYIVKYQYNPIDNDYTRFVGGKEVKTEAGFILKAKNIVVQKVSAKVIDSYGRLDIDLKSGGQATICQDGRKIEGSWKKSYGRTRFYDDRGQEIKFNRGSIWIELSFK
jgi:hypothetical protein